MTENLLTCSLKLTIVTHSQFMSTVTVSMQVTITTPPTSWIEVFTDTFDGDHGDWTMTEKVSSKLSLI